MEYQISHYKIISVNTITFLYNTVSPRLGVRFLLFMKNVHSITHFTQRNIINSVVSLTLSDGNIEYKRFFSLHIAT